MQWMDRNQKQKEIVSKWIENKGIGTLEACTGFGKTRVAILLLKRFYKNNSSKRTTIVVPTRELKKQWKERIEKAGLKSSPIHVTVINTAVKEGIDTTFLIIDEIHNAGAVSFSKIFKQRYAYILGLTATMEREDNRHFMIETYAPVIERVSLEEARENGWVSDYQVVNLGIPLKGVELAEFRSIEKGFSYNFSFFGHNFGKAMECLQNEEARIKYAKFINCEPKEVMVRAVNFSRYMRKRKHYLSTTDSKLRIAVELLNKLKLKTITFSETKDFVNKLQEKTGATSVVYHSKLSKKKKDHAIESFNSLDSPVSILHSIRSLDEGLDAPGVQCSLICSGTSTKKQNTQRTGRSVRYEEDKIALIVNLYHVDTQEEKWLHKRQKGQKNIFWVDSVEDVIKLRNQEELIEHDTRYSFG